MNLEEKVLDRLDKTLIEVRESVSPSLSDVLLGFGKKLDEQALEMKKHVDMHLINDKKVNDSLQRIEILQELVPIVREKLLPVYEKQMSREQARAILREDLEMWSNRGRVWLIFVGVVVSIGAMLKFWVLK